MDMCRSFYLASRQDDFVAPGDGTRLDFNGIPYIMPANDNRGPKIGCRHAAVVCFVV